MSVELNSYWFQAADGDGRFALAQGPARIALDSERLVAELYASDGSGLFASGGGLGLTTESLIQLRWNRSNGCGLLSAANLSHQFWSNGADDGLAEWSSLALGRCRDGLGRRRSSGVRCDRVARRAAS